jgi:hypothetical protein
LLDVVVDDVLTLKVRDKVFSAGDSLAIWKSAPDVMFEGGGLGSSSREVYPLSALDSDGGLGAGGAEWFEEVRDGKDVV